jgi:hypothetical protein
MSPVLLPSLGLPAAPRRARHAGLLLGLLAAAAASTSATRVSAAEGAAPQVTLSLDEYERLRGTQERPSLTVVDTLRLSGSFRGRDVQLEFSGRAAGRLPPAPVLSAAGDVVVYGCQGDGLVSRAEQGGFQLTPLAARFVVRCRVQTRGSDRLELTTTAAVLWVESAVSDGELVATGAQAGEHTFALVRQAAGPATGLMEPTATGRYRLTLLPDETRFRYQIDVNNPNRGQHAFTLTLSSGELVQQIDSAAPHDSAGARTTFELPPGESTVTLSGRLSGAAFAPPVEASLQYVLVESHPLLRPQIAGGARRVAPNEVGLPAGFRGAQAFLLGRGDRLSWGVTRLQALRSTSYALQDVRHVFYLGADGAALGESSFALDNQGASELRLPRTVEPTFASLQGETVLLTKDDEGRLLLPIAQGAQTLLVQHRQAFGARLGFARALMAAPELPVPATRTQVELRYPHDWLPLYESFASRSRVWTPSAGELLSWLLLCAWSTRVLALLGLERRARWRLAVLASLAAYAWDPAALLAWGACLVLTLAWGLGRLRGRAWSLARALAALAALLVAGLLLLALVSSLHLGGSRTQPTSRAEYERARVPASAPVPGRMKAGSGAAPQDALASPEGSGAEQMQYEGLPARLELPMGERRSSFERELLTPGAPRRLEAIMISAQALEGLRLLVLLATALTLWLRRQALVAGWRRIAGSWRAEPVSASAA